MMSKVSIPDAFRQFCLCLAAWVQMSLDVDDIIAMHMLASSAKDTHSECRGPKLVVCLKIQCQNSLHFWLC